MGPSSHCIHFSGEAQALPMTLYDVHKVLMYIEWNSEVILETK